MKDELLKKIIQEIERELNTIVASAFEAKEAATNEESKAENKYDTRGLEASYLAGAQSKRAMEIQRNLSELKKQQLKRFNSETPIDTTALVEIEIEDEDHSQWFFILPQSGGMKIRFGDKEILVVSRTSPIAQKMIGKKEGDSFEHMKKTKSFEYTIKSVQ